MENSCQTVDAADSCKTRTAAGSGKTQAVNKDNRVQPWIKVLGDTVDNGFDYSGGDEIILYLKNGLQDNGLAA